MKTHGSALFLAACTVLVSAASAVGLPTALNPAPERLREYADGCNSFATDLYLSLSGGGDDIFLSPYSISTAMAMTYAGARGTTAGQMRHVLHFTLGGDTLHAAAGELSRSLEDFDEDSAGFGLTSVNALWGQAGHEFLPEYLGLVSTYYDAAPATLDFSRDPSACRDSINSWISGKTRGRIEDMIPPGTITTATRLVLANAISFSALWRTQFDPMSTTERPFTLIDGSCVEVPLMAISEHFRIAAGDGYRAVELPYLDTSVCMLIVLPDSGRFEEIEDRMGREFIEDITMGLSDASLDLRLPRFSSTSWFSLGDVLVSMGMTAPFGGQADFSGMDGTRWLYISSVVHQAVISVDELGTEASAATAVVMEKLNGEPSRPFHVDRPFIYMIMDRESGAILFLGRMMNPARGQP